jgi:hypothetical protein
VGKRNKKRKNKGWFRWPLFEKEKFGKKKKKKHKKNKITWIEDPSVPEKFESCWHDGKTVIGRRAKDGTVEFFEVQSIN